MANITARAEAVNNMAKRMRIKALDMAFKSGRKGAHLGPAFSCMEIMAALYGDIMNVDSSDADNINRDRFIASKAHCVLAHYTALHEKGYISDEELETFQEDNTQFGGHPVLDTAHGMEYTGGSLGMALSVGVGMALDAKLKGRSNKVYILLGDGECQEGSNWEAIMSAAQYKLDNLVIIVDKNGLQYDGHTEDVMNIDNLADKFRAFGCFTEDVDGHDAEALLEVLEHSANDKPHAIIAHTIKGKGVSFMEDVREWHHGTLSKSQYEQALQEVGGSDICQK
ncbi:MAG: transketolase [Clostridia bacterium]|nr:transketolase [Clostridia bacterium]